jgi:ABC-2 type transport system permease protein
MPALHRVFAVFYKYLLTYRRNFDPVLASVYMPVLDLILWGLTVRWFNSTSVPGADYYKLILTALVFWHIIDRLNTGISLNFLEEIWSTHLAGFFSTPLRISEWMLGTLLLGLCTTGLTLGVASLAAWLLYQVNIFALGFYILPFLLVLIIFGWSLGFLITGIIAGFGTRIQSLAWYIAFLAAPFSAIYYPVDMLPGWAQAVSSFLPSSYVFEGMREVLQSGNFRQDLFCRAILLALTLLAAAGCFFVRMFEKRRRLGLSSFN